MNDRVLWRGLVVGRLWPTKFQVNKLADGANVAIDDHNGIVNGPHTLIKSLMLK